MGPIGQKKLNY